MQDFISTRSATTILQINVFRRKIILDRLPATLSHIDTLITVVVAMLNCSVTEKLLHNEVITS